MKRMQFSKTFAFIRKYVITQYRSKHHQCAKAICLWSIYGLNALEIGLYLCEENRSALRPWEIWL